MASKIIELGNKIKISCEPFMDSGYLFKSMYLNEEIGGSMAYGNISFTSGGENLSLITDQDDIKISIVKSNGGSTYNIKGFITSREYLGNEVTFNFVCSNKDFLVSSRVVRYTDISDAINTLYPYEKNIEIESDINNEIEINQNGKTDYELCRNLAMSYRYNTIFSFGLEGFSIKDINKEPEITVMAMTASTQMDKFSINYYKQFDITPEINESSNNILAISNNDSNYLLHKSYDQLMTNYLYNTRYLTDFYTSFSVMYNSDIPDYKIGDVIIYKENTNFPRTKYLVSRIVIDADMKNISTTAFFRGIEKGGSENG